MLVRCGVVMVVRCGVVMVVRCGVVMLVRCGVVIIKTIIIMKNLMGPAKHKSKCWSIKVIFSFTKKQQPTPIQKPLTFNSLPNQGVNSDFAIFLSPSRPASVRLTNDNQICFPPSFTDV
jgi:hypothetical protein